MYCYMLKIYERIPEQPELLGDSELLAPGKRFERLRAFAPPGFQDQPLHHLSIQANDWRSRSDSNTRGISPLWHFQCHLFTSLSTTADFGAGDRIRTCMGCDSPNGFRNHPLHRLSTPADMAWREGFEPSQELLPLTD